MDRITTLNTSKQLTNYMSLQETKYNNLSVQVSSGVKLTSVSQDPAAAREVLNINTKTAQLQGYLNNMSTATQELNMLDNTLSSASTLVNRISDLATQAANGTYSDKNLDEIKTEVSIGGISRRLFMGNEFDKRGINSIHCLNCDRKEKCGKDKINIIDGTSGERITHFDNADVNLALPKMEFAQRILNKEPPFDNFNFDSFIELFEIIKEILELPLV